MTARRARLGLLIGAIAAVLYAFLAVALAQQSAICSDIARFVASMTGERATIYARMKDNDGDRREIWVRPDGHWIIVFYPSHLEGQVCLAGRGGEFETFYPARKGTGS